MYKSPYKNFKANYKGKDISGKDMANEPLYEINLKNAVCRDTDFSCSSLWGANLEGADLSTANLTHTDLSYIIYDKHTKFPSFFDLEIHMSDYKRFRGLSYLDKLKSCTYVHLGGIIFSGKWYRNHNFSATSFNFCVFIRADVSNSSFRNCIFVGTPLYGANCYNCDFSGVDLSDTILANTNLNGCNLKGAKLDGGTIFPTTNLNNIKFDEHTVFDKGFNLARHIENFDIAMLANDEPKTLEHVKNEYSRGW